MVNISKIGDSAIKFTFTDNDRYLYNGEITLPLNSLILEFDTSDLVIFKKIDGDVFVTFLLENSNFDSKDSLIEFYKTSMVGSTGGGGGVTSGEVQTMIDEAVSGKADSSDVYTTGQTSGATQISNALAEKIDVSDFNAYSGNVATALGEKASQSTVDTLSGTVTAHTSDSTIHLTSGDIQTQIDNSISGKADTTAVTEEISAAVSGKADSSAVTEVSDALTAHTANTTVHITAAERTAWNAKSDFSGSYNDLTDKPTIPTVPTSNTAFTNDAGYATSGYVDSSVSGKVSTSDFETYSAETDSRLAIDEEVTAAALNNLNEALSGKQDTLIAGENITISGNVISATGGGGGTVDGTSLFGGIHYTSEGTSIKYFNQMIEGGKPSALKFVVGNGNNTYSSAITITLYDTEDYNEHHNTLTISSSGGVVTSITEVNGGSFTGITVDSDWVLRPAEGYYFFSYQWLTNYYGFGLRISPKDGVIESGSTTDVIENGIYKQLQRHEENIGNLAISAVTSTNLSFKDESGITLTTNASSTALAVDDSLKYTGKLGVYVTGDTYTTNLNSESATTYLMFDDIKNVDMWLNQSYTGTPSGWYTINLRSLDGNQDYYLYENDTFTLVSGSAGSTLNYDSSTGKVTITCPSGISVINNNYKFAPADDLTNADCFIGLVSYTSNEYPLQEAIDNKQNTLTAGTGISIVDNVISATGGGGGGVSVVEVTQAEYDELPSSAKTDTSKMYVITDAQAVDLSQYWTSAQTNSAITQATSGKQDTLSAGTGIDITDNVISVTGMVETSAVTSAVTSGSTDVLTSGGAYEQFGGLKLVKLTESEYTALVTKGPNVLYVVIPDPQNP